MPKVSVIVPNYNHAQFLPERLDSILNQTYQDFEIIILDDASTDNSIEIVKSYLEQYPDKIKFYPSKKNSGSPFIQWQNGILKAAGEYIWIAESDDLASTWFLENLVPLMTKYADVAIICAKSNAIDGIGNEISNLHPVYRGFEEELFPKTESNIKYYNGTEFIQKVLVNRCLIPNVSATLIRKSAYLKVGGIDTSFIRSGDYNIYFKIFEYYDVIFYNMLLNSTRYHDDKLTAKNNIVSFHERYTTLKGIFKKYEISKHIKVESGNFYFKVYTHDIFLNNKIEFFDKLKCFLELAELFPHLFINFSKLLMSRAKINISKKING